MRHIHHFLLLVSVLCASDLFAQTADEKAIQKIMDNQVYYWNKADLDNFVKGYWNNDSVMFIGKNGIVYGYNNTLQRYKNSYSDTAQMGKLQFTILHVTKLSPEYYSLVGKFYLTRSMGDLSGHFTLLFRKIKGEWKIISDHSS